jgi:hypothetical protein
MKLKLVEPGELALIKHPPMLVNKILPLGSICILAGATFSGKTFFAMEMAKALATQDPFMGHYKIPRRGNTLFIEQDAPQHDTGRAMYAMIREKREDQLIVVNEMGLPPEDLYGDGIYFCFHPGLDLRKADDMVSIAEAANSLYTVGRWESPQVRFVMNDDGNIEEFIDTFPSNDIKGCSLIVLDTLRSLHGAEENDSTQMELVMQNLKKLRAATGATILIVHHKRKEQRDFFGSSGSRGSTAIDAAADNVFEFKSSRKTKTSKCISIKARVISAPNIEFSIISKSTADGENLKEVQFIREIDEEIPVEETQSSKEMCYTYIAQNKEGITTEDLSVWANLNGLSPKYALNIASKLVVDQRISKESFVEKGKHRVRYSVPREGTLDVNHNSKVV